MSKNGSFSLTLPQNWYFKTKPNFCLQISLEFESERLEVKLTTRGILKLIFLELQLEKAW